MGNTPNNMDHKIDHTMWRGMKNCGSKCTFLCHISFAFSNMWRRSNIHPCRTLISLWFFLSLFTTIFCQKMTFFVLLASPLPNWVVDKRVMRVPQALFEPIGASFVVPCKSIPSWRVWRWGISLSLSWASFPPRTSSYASPNAGRASPEIHPGYPEKELWLSMTYYL